MSTPKFVVSIVLLIVSASAAAQVEPEEFTQRFIEHLQQQNGDVGIRDVEPLKFVVTTDEGGEHTAFLDNAYDLYLQDEAAMQQIIGQYAAALLESVTRVDEALSAENIVPVIKDTAWLAEVARVTSEQGQESAPELYTRAFAEGLIVVYAEDTPTNIRYVGRADIEEIGVADDSIAELSIENLLARLPEIQVHGSDGLYMVTAGGYFEPSLMLVDDMWNADNFDVQGETVVCVPARDTLLVTGSQDEDNLEKLVEISEEIYAESPYRLTTKLYVWRRGGWQLLLR